MATKFKVKRSTVSGVTPTTVDIDTSELAINLPDRKLFTSNGTAVYELGSNLTNLSVSGVITGTTGVFPATDTTGNIGNSTLTWADGNFNNLTIDSTLSVRAAIDLADSDVLRFGSSDDAYFVYNGTSNFLELQLEAAAIDFRITDNGTSKFTFTKTTGNLDAAGSINAAALSVGTSVAANTTNLTVGPGVGLTANGGLGTAGQVLSSNGSSVYWANSANVSSIVSQQFTANGTANSFTVSGGYIPSAIEVYVTGVKKIPVTEIDITSGTTVNFVTPPLNGQIVDVFGYQSTGSISGYLPLAGGTLSGVATFSANIVLGSSGLSANGSFGTAGHVLHSNGTASYWAADDQGVTSVATGSGLTGGTITSTGTISVLANTGIVANATGLYVDASYINTISSNSATYANASISNTFTVGTASYFVANGNVGIGTNLPAGKLAVVSSASGAYELARFQGTANGNPYVHVIGQGGSPIHQVLSYGPHSTASYPSYNIQGYYSNSTGGDVGGSPTFGFYRYGGNNSVTFATPSGVLLGQLAFYGSNSTSAVYGGGFDIVSEAAFTTAPTTGMRFITANTTASYERMRVAADGDVRVGDAGIANGVGRYFDIYNLGSNSSSFSVVRLITQSVANTNTTSVDIIKYKNGLFTLNNNDGDSSVATTFGVGGSERMRLAANGNVGIGNTAPNAKLQVTGTANVSGNVVIGGSLSSANLTTTTNTATFGTNVYLAAGGNSAIGTSNTTSARLRIDTTGGGGYGRDAPNIWLTNGNDPGIRMMNTSNATLNHSATMYVPGGAGGWVVTCDTNAAFDLSTDTSGNFTARGNVTAYSDAKLKKDVENIQNALATVMQLRGVKFRRIDNDDDVNIGFIAQEIQEHVPEVVHNTLEGYLGVSYGNIVALLTEAIKEQQQQIEQLRSEIKEMRT